MHPLSDSFIGDAAVALYCMLAVGVTMGFLALKRYLIGCARRSVPVRIHVAGTRGKSTTVRLIDAGLRGCGARVAAKITGTTPSIIDTNGRERRIRRFGAAAIREQEWFLLEARRQGAEIAVMECMAIQPEFVWASQHLIVQATVTVIVNVHPDHSEELGSTPAAMQKALANLVPRAGTVVIGDGAENEVILDTASRLGAEVRVVRTAGLPPLEALRALATEACVAAGESRAAAARCIERSEPEDGAHRVRELLIDGRQLLFVHAFSCNDAQSLAAWWARHQGGADHPVLLNARPDRPLRTREMLDFLRREGRDRPLFVAGDPLATRMARRMGFRNVRRVGDWRAERLLTELARATPPGATAWGIGNYRGMGERFDAALREEASCSLQH